MPQACITKANEIAGRGPLYAAARLVCGNRGRVRQIPTRIRHASAGLGILCREPGRNRADAENLPVMVRIERASVIATRSGDDQLPRGGFRQIADPTQKMRATYRD